MITFFQPRGFTDEFFDEQIKLVDIELAKLKELLEATLVEFVITAVTGSGHDRNFEEKLQLTAF
jgi:hypothetical protein